MAMTLKESIAQFPTKQQAKEACVVFAITQLNLALMRRGNVMYAVAKTGNEIRLVEVINVDHIWHATFVKLVEWKQELDDRR